jgi:type I restriction enzyme S subunit
LRIALSPTGGHWGLKMLPSGWDRTTYESLADFRNGLNFAKSDSGESIKIVGVSDFKDFAELTNLKGLDIISVANKVNENDLIESGDLLFVRSNGNKELIGRCLFFPKVSEKLSFSGFTIRGRVKSERIFPEYLSIISRSNIVKQQFSRNGGGTNISNLSQQILNDVVIPLPPLSEQKKIAQILSTWDKAITTTEQLIANSQQQKKALMQQLLTGKKRLLDDNGVRFSGEWKLAEIGEFLSESRISSPNNDPSKRLTVRLNLKGIEPREFRGTEAIDATAHFVRSAGQFIYGKQNIHKGAFGIIPNSLDGFETSQDLPAFDFSGKCDSTWFFHFMSQEHFFNSLEDKMSGTGSKRLNPKTFLKLKVLCPQLVEQQKIALVLSSADREIELLQSKLTALKQEKKALMQQLLTGKRRVKI